MKRYILLICILSILCNSFAQSLSIEDVLIPKPKKVKVDYFQRFILTKNTSAPSYLKSSGSIYTKLNDAIIAQGWFNILKATSLFEKRHDVQFKIDPAISNKQAYHMSISKKGAIIKAGSDAGLWNAVTTLNQLAFFAEKNEGFPAIEIEDWPDFERRGVMLDISRDKVPSMQTLFALIDQLSEWKINEFQLYTEHTFAYKNHKKVWEEASPMTATQIQQLDSYCRERFIDLVPNQNSFGHMERWLKHDAYLHLAESPKPVKTIWGMRSRTSLSPLEEGSLELMEELFDELIPNFSSEYVNIGCDETVELGCGKSKTLCKKEGKGKVYLDFLKKLRTLVEKHDRKVQFWGDIILHHPKLIPVLPKDMVALIWGYEAKHPFHRQCKAFKKAGLEFYVCPGTATWRTIVGRYDNAKANLLNAAQNGKKYGAKGFLNTNWGDNGHWQPQSVCYPPYLYGAAVSWGVDQNRNIDVGHLLDIHLFKDENSGMGQLLVDLGNAYLKTEAMTSNSNAFFQLLREADKSFSKSRYFKTLTLENINNALRSLQDCKKRLESVKIGATDKDIVIQETEQAINLAIHACHVAILKLKQKDRSLSSISTEERKKIVNELSNLIENHERIWMLRNRVGGLSDSKRKMESILEKYKTKN